MDDGIDPFKRVRIKRACLHIPTKIPTGTLECADLMTTLAKRRGKRGANQAGGTGDKNCLG